jgi:hypothetical protein
VSAEIRSSSLNFFRLDELLRIFPQKEDRVKIRTPVIVLAFFLLAAGTSLPYAHAKISTLNATVFANGMYVTAGFDGTILTGSTMANMTPRKSGTRSSLFGVVYGKGMFVAVGGDGTIFTSQDGKQWTFVQGN